MRVWRVLLCRRCGSVSGSCVCLLFDVALAADFVAVFVKTCAVYVGVDFEPVFECFVCWDCVGAVEEFASDVVKQECVYRSNSTHGDDGECHFVDDVEEGLHSSVDFGFSFVLMDEFCCISVEEDVCCCGVEFGSALVS